MSYNTIPSGDIIEKTLANAAGRNISVTLVDTKEEALAKVRSLIPDGAEVMTGSSTTLDQIGFVDLLKSGAHPWKNLKDAIVAETDPVKQAALRRESILSQYFLGSVHAILEDGRTLTASASGSQIPSYAFSSDNVIWVAGAQKIVPTLDEAFTRVHEYVWPLEDARMKSVGASGSVFGKVLLFEREVMPNRHVNLILVKEVLGF